jgi:hypothetical protein
MKTMLGRQRCTWCQKWLPLVHDSRYCSNKCEKEHNEELAWWDRYNEEIRQLRIQSKKEYRNKQNKCLNCEESIIQKDKGRFRRYCDDTCKQEAYRKRKKGAIS